MPIEQPDVQAAIDYAFWKYSNDRSKELDENNTNLCHYTSAENLVKIARNKQVWLRNTLLMNDYSEVQHGRQCVWNALHDVEISAILERIFLRWGRSFWDDFFPKYEEKQGEIIAHTYILSLSEHDTGTSEDSLGRLSMWRAYGGDTNVALVLKRQPVLYGDASSFVVVSPVFYGDMSEFRQHALELVNRIEEKAETLLSIPFEKLCDQLAYCLDYAALSTKHAGFKEEREWRLIFSPTRHHSERITPSVEVIGGVPQPVMKLSLDHIQHTNAPSLDELLQKVLIGPTQFPLPILQSIQSELSKAGVERPDVSLSNIPLRR